MKALIFSAVFSFTVKICFAQTAGAILNRGVGLSTYNYAMRFNPLAMIDPSEPNFSVGMEWKYKKNYSVGIDASFIFASSYYANAAVSRPLGFIIRPFFRYYYWNKYKYRLFFQPEIFYKYVNYAIEDWVQINDSGNNVVYHQYSNFSIEKNVFVAGLKWGGQTVFFKNPNLMFEWFAGLGLRLGKVELHDLPSNATYSINRIFATDRTKNLTYFTPNIMAGVTIAYSFKHRIKSKIHP